MSFDESKVRRERGKFANKDAMRDEAGVISCTFCRISDICCERIFAKSFGGAAQATMLPNKKTQHKVRYFFCILQTPSAQWLGNDIA
ncbi:MAG: hypothetical protein Q4G42_09220 [Neisseria sp.]|nr:hypothetical protein [Neisseria sp.]